MQGEEMLGIDPPSTFGPVDFAAMGRAMGAQGFRADSIAEARAALAEAWTCDGPVVIDVATSKSASPSVDWGTLDPDAASAFGAYGMG